ncbi:MAG: hypothetical protein U1C55_03165 [Smithellaceae bacterium]|nr:hypothetical protein [Smithellaceae bacterium]
MKKRISLIVLLVILTQLFLLPFCPAEARAETRIYITFAAGGVAGGVYFFFRFAFSGSSMMEQYQNDTTALLNHGPAGWQIKYPVVNLGGEARDILPRPVHSPEMAQVEILKVRF